MAKTILQGAVKRIRRIELGRQHKGLLSGLEFVNSVRAVESRVGWRRIVEMSSVVTWRP